MSPLRQNLARMLDEYACDQAALQRSAWTRRRSRFRYEPAPLHQDAVHALGRGSEEDVARFIHHEELAPYLGTVKRSLEGKS